MGRNEHDYWTRFEARRLSRRRFVGTAAAASAGAAAIGLAGCGGGDDDDDGPVSAAATSTPAPTPVATAAPKRGGTYQGAFTGPFAGVDPHNSVYGGAGVVPVVYNYLLRASAAPETAAAKGIIYDLAESHRREADNVTYVFKLRSDVKLHPNKYGIPERVLDSDDVKASFDRIADAKAGANAYGFVKNWVDKFDAPDKTTFRLITKKPFAYTEPSIGSNLYGAIVPKEWLAHADLKKDSVGAGPFMLKQLTEGQSAVMERNPNYYRKDRPYLDSYVIKAFADQATYRTAFQANQIDIYGPTNKDESNELKSADKTLQQYSDPGLSFNSFWMNTKEKPWDDARVRRAVNRAINRKEYIDIIGHGVGEPIGPLTYAFKEALPAAELAKVQPFDVAEAKKLFQEAGVTEFKFQHPTSSNMVDYVNIFVRQMQAAGVTAKPEPLDAGTWVAGYFQSKLTASFSLNQQYQTPDWALQWWHTGGITGNNRYDTGWAFADVDAAIDKAASTLDATARIAAYQDVQKLILSKDPAMVHIFGQRVEVLVRPFVKNYVPGVGSLVTAFIDNFWVDKA